MIRKPKGLPSYSSASRTVFRVLYLVNNKISQVNLTQFLTWECLRSWRGSLRRAWSKWELALRKPVVEELDMVDLGLMGLVGEQVWVELFGGDYLPR